MITKITNDLWVDIYEISSIFFDSDGDTPRMRISFKGGIGDTIFIGGKETVAVMRKILAEYCGEPLT